MLTIDFFCPYAVSMMTSTQQHQAFKPLQVNQILVSQNKVSFLYPVIWASLILLEIAQVSYQKVLSESFQMLIPILNQLLQ
jgi:hypothetical protein